MPFSLDRLFAPGDVILEVILFLVAAVLAALGVQKLRWSPVVGYLVAGALLGPHGLNLVSDSPPLHVLAEFGVVFLMFTIGIELSFERLRAMRRLIFGLGFLQVAITATAGTLLAMAFDLDAPAAAVVGLALALSSTAIVMRLLIDEEALAGRVGRRAFAVLLFQDIAVAPILLMVGILGDRGERVSLAALEALGAAVLAIALVFLIGRLLARPLFRAVAGLRSPDLFAAATLLVVLASAWAMNLAGLSMALGAFLAGLMLAETEFAPQVELDIEPYRGLLLGLFFITVGMSIDPRLLLDNLATLGGVLLLLVLGKTGILTLMARPFGLGWGSALRLGLLLAQGGEFAFVVFAAAQGFGLLAPGTAQILSVAVGLSIALTPLLAALGQRLERQFEGHRIGKADFAEIGRNCEGHVILAGFGRVGQTLARLMSEQRIGFVALDLDPHRIAESARQGIPVFYGNAASPEMLKKAGLGKAALLVITLDNPASASRSVATARRLNADIPIVARARDPQHARELEALGATAAVPETVEASLQLGGQALRWLGLDHNTVDEIIERLRSGDYAALGSLASPRHGGA
ncbi:MAG: monovalent cation:proton antiporter-2 (CPA2) family protein [Rhodothalassiaceae bacterium]